MRSTIRMEATVLPGHRLEVSAPECPRVEVIVVVRSSLTAKFDSALEYLESLPPGPRAFKTWEEYHDHLRTEKAAWDR